MDIMLTRILSLVPKKPDGSFEHGALKAFAQSIGLKSGNLISDWINGRSASYKNYIYKISSVYGVSVEWLKGDTDEKWPSTAEGEGLLDAELVRDLLQLTPAEAGKVRAFVKGLLAGREV